jgi:hypothetical protein
MKGERSELGTIIVSFGFIYSFTTKPLKYCNSLVVTRRKRERKTKKQFFEFLFFLVRERKEKIQSRGWLRGKQNRYGR